jgi:hypothetical protein
MADTDFTTGTWQITDNANWSQQIPFADRNGLPYDFTGSTFRVDLKVNRTDPTAVLSLTTANGGITATSGDLTNGTVTVNIAQGQLAAGSYLGELLRVTGSREFMMLLVINVTLGVT